MGTFIEVDTVALNNDKNTANEMIIAVQKELESVYDQVAELNAMWDGVANEAFNQVFASDRQLFDAICEEGKALVSSIESAKAEYEKCEMQVNEAISAIRI